MIYKIIRIILGLLFVVSGWVKAIDPVGMSYKIGEYLASFGMDWLVGYDLAISVLLCALELFIGILLVSGLWQKFISYATFVFLSGFTLLTFYLVLNPGSGISHCGCFGDAIVLTDMETFIKNVIFVILAFFYARYNFKLGPHVYPFKYGSRHLLSPVELKRILFFRSFVYLYIWLFCLVIPVYSALYLPPYDYLPFNRGVSVIEDMTLPEGADEGEVLTKLVYKNKKSGESRDFDPEDTEWQNEELWEYVDTKTITVREPVKPKIESFAVTNQEGQDMTVDLFGREGYSFIVIADQIESLSDSDFAKLKGVQAIYNVGKINLVVFTASDLNETEAILKRHDWKSVSAYNVDITNLKSMLRQPKGVILLKDGVIEGKWNFRSNTFANLKNSDLQALVHWERFTNFRYFVVIGILFLIMIYFMIMYHKNFRTKKI